MIKDQRQPSGRRRLSLAYVAGFIDADGAIVISRGGDRTHRHKWYNIFVTISQKEPEILYLIQEKYGGLTQIHNREKIDINHKLAHTWRIQSNQAYAFLKRIYPKLIIKRQQALLAMRLQENILKHKNKFSNNGLPVKILEYRESLRQQNKELNQPFSPASTEFSNIGNDEATVKTIMKVIEQEP